MIKEKSLMVINSGQKVYIFELLEGLREGKSGISHVWSNEDIIRKCEFESIFRQEFSTHPQYFEKLVSKQMISDESVAGDWPNVKQFRIMSLERESKMLCCALLQNGQAAMYINSG